MASSTIPRSKKQKKNIKHSTTQEVIELRSSLSLPRRTFARLVGRTERAIADWESGKKVPQDISLQRIKELQRLTEALQEFIPEDSLGTWLSTPNKAFGDQKPIEVIERGEIDRLWRMIYEVNSGTPG